MSERITKKAAIDDKNTKAIIFPAKHRFLKAIKWKNCVWRDENWIKKPFFSSTITSKLTFCLILMLDALSLKHSLTQSIEFTYMCILMIISHCKLNSLLSVNWCKFTASAYLNFLSFNIFLKRSLSMQERKKKSFSVRLFMHLLPFALSAKE